jgi:uncharacterized membrane protein HdeD (DUF308 family)
LRDQGVGEVAEQISFCAIARWGILQVLHGTLLMGHQFAGRQFSRGRFLPCSIMMSKGEMIGGPSAAAFAAAEGMAGIILGLMILTAPDVTTVALVSFVGLYWLIVGILALLRVFVDQSVPWFWSLVTGIAGILAGIFVARHPLLAALTVPTVIVLVLGVLGPIMGAIEIVGGFMGGGIGSFIPGVIYLLAGLLLLGPPIAAVLAAPLVFGVLFLVQGVALTAFAFRART